jgi:ubiquinone/menaquinone biosynthesis C-methylase UbiE
MDMDARGGSQKEMKANEFLQKYLREEAQYCFGRGNEESIIETSRAWMNDISNSKHRFDTISEFLPDARKILDVASGCGTFVYYGMLNNYDIYGIEPEKWKQGFNQLKAAEYGYPSAWTQRFVFGVGEELPFKDNSFDCISTYQTLEHVKNPQQCLREMLRVTRTGGGIHLMCPDYRSTYEGHYLLPWIPLFPRHLAKIYLRLLHRSMNCLNGITYTTQPRIMHWLRNISVELGCEILLVDLHKKKFLEILKKHGLPTVPWSYSIYRMFVFIKNLFRVELQINMFVYVKKSDYL